jgi:hypothetical protein
MLKKESAPEAHVSLNIPFSGAMKIRGLFSRTTHDFWGCYLLLHIYLFKFSAREQTTAACRGATIEFICHQSYHEI